jgi:transcriptional regulator with XRE-family HTH domain
MSPSPLQRIRHTYDLRVVEIAAAAGVSIDTVRRIDRLDVETLWLASLVKVAHAVGVTPVDLVPGLARMAGGGLVAQRERTRSRHHA